MLFGDLLNYWIEMESWSIIWLLTAKLKKKIDFFFFGASVHARTMLILKIQIRKKLLNNLFAQCVLQEIDTQANK